MGWGAPGNGPEIEDVQGGDPAGGALPRGAPDVVGARLARVRRWLPVVLVGGVAVLIVGAGLLGPKDPAGDGPSSTPVAASAGPEGGPSPGASPSAALSPPTLPVPVLRLAGPPPEDGFVLLGGRWIDLVAGATGVETGCELERPLVLAGGRIVCVAQDVVRPPGSILATYELSAVTLGRSRRAPATPWATAPPGAADGVRPAVPLTTLVGRRDLAFGDPVAVALAPGAEPDTLLLAWAVLGDDGYRVGLDGYRIGDANVDQAGSRQILALPFEGERGPTSLADLAVSASPDGTMALVGVTVVPAQPAPAERRLAILPLDSGAVPGRWVGPSAALPPAVSSNAAGPAAAARDAGTPCGGSLGEGWADEQTLFLVCPGHPSVFRRVAIFPSARGVPDHQGPRGPAGILDETVLTPESGATALWLAGNGVAVDRGRGRYYRWSPQARTLWAIDLLAAGGAQATARSVNLASPGLASPGAAAVEPIALADDRPAPRPVVALDEATDRLFLLAPGDAGQGASIDVVSGTDLTPRGRLATAPEPFATMALSPDGRLLYLATPPRAVAGAQGPQVAVAVLDTEPLAERLFRGRLPPGAWDPAQALVVR